MRPGQCAPQAPKILVGSPLAVLFGSVRGLRVDVRVPRALVDRLASLERALEDRELERVRLEGELARRETAAETPALVASAGHELSKRTISVAPGAR